MKRIKKWWRLVYIAYIWNKYNLVDIVADLPLMRLLRFTMYLNPLYWISNKKQLPRGERLRLALETLGPIFIKFGQALSTRPDLIPPDLAIELSRLQDKVPPFPEDESVAIIEKALGKSVETLFASFTKKPLASASIAQVHSATLHNGQEVIIKVLRPGIKKVLLNDTALLTSIAAMVERYIPATKRLKPTEVVSEIKRDLMDELDMLREAANASQLRRNFKDSPIHYVPEIHWDYCNRDILVMEKVHGVRASDVDTLREKGVNLKLLAERGVEIFYTQVFRDCFFHADMHPGNIFIDATNPEDPGYISIDFGIMGTLTREDQQYLAGNFLAFFKRDYKRVAELHIESGWVPTTTRVDELEAAIRTVCEPIFEKPLSEISFGQTLVRLFQVAQRFNMEVQPQLILLQKTLLNIEGMGRQLYPELNLWETAKPFLVKWMKRHIGFKGFMKRVIEHTPEISEKLPEVPDLLIEILENKRYQLRHAKELEKINERVLVQQKLRSKRRGLVLASGTGLLIYAVLYNGSLDTLAPIKLFFEHYASQLGLAGAAIIAWYLFTQPNKHE